MCFEMINLFGRVDKIKSTTNQQVSVYGQSTIFKKLVGRSLKYEIKMGITIHDLILFLNRSNKIGSTYISIILRLCIWLDSNFYL